MWAIVIFVKWLLRIFLWDVMFAPARSLFQQSRNFYFVSSASPEILLPFGKGTDTFSIRTFSCPLGEFQSFRKHLTFSKTFFLFRCIHSVYLGWTDLKVLLPLRSGRAVLFKTNENQPAQITMPLQRNTCPKITREKTNSFTANRKIQQRTIRINNQ